MKVRDLIQNRYLLRNEGERMKELNWINAIEWGKIHCPMLGKEVMTYYPEGSKPYDTYTNPFVNEDGEVLYYRFDQDEGYWLEEPYWLEDLSERF